MSENGEFYTTGKNFTLPPAVTARANSTSAPPPHLPFEQLVDLLTIFLNYGYCGVFEHRFDPPPSPPFWTMLRTAILVNWGI